MIRGGKIAKRKIVLPHFYRNLALGFCGLSLILLLFILYFTRTKVIITLIPAEEKVATEFTIMVVEESTSTPPLNKEKAVSGLVRGIESFGAQIFPASGKKTILAADIVGEVTIINNYSQPQILMATTRLLSPSGVLLRLKNRVEVLPGGSVKALVYPDKPESFESLAPTKFTIPGLWQPLQAKIYAESKEPLRKRDQTISFVSKEDLEKAENDIKDYLYQESLALFNKELDSRQLLWSKVSKSKILEKKTSHNIGDQIPEFKMEMNFGTIFIALDEAQILSLAKNKLRATLSAGRKIINPDSSNVSYLIEDYNLESKVAEIKVYVEGGAKGDIEGLNINKKELLGKNLKDLKSYFAQFSGIKEVKIDFFPRWLQRTPTKENRIFIKKSE